MVLSFLADLLFPNNLHVQDLARMYTLFARVPSGLKRLLDVMSEHLREVGKKIVTDPEKYNMVPFGLDMRN